MLIVTSLLIYCKFIYVQFLFSMFLQVGLVTTFQDIFAFPLFLFVYVHENWKRTLLKNVCVRT